MAQLDSGVRGRFSYGYTDDMLKQPEKPIDLVDVARVQRDWFNGGTDGMLSLGVALRGPENMAAEHRDTYVKEIETARKLGIPSHHSRGAAPRCRHEIAVDHQARTPTDCWGRTFS